MNKPDVLLDSCVLASFFLVNDSGHQEALQTIKYLFSKPEEINIILAPLVIYETSVVAIRSGYSEVAIANRLHKLLTYDQVIVISLSELAVFKHLHRTAHTSVRQPQIRTHDMLILNTAIDFGALVLSSDRPLLSVCHGLDYPACSTINQLAAYQF